MDNLKVLTSDYRYKCEVQRCVDGDTVDADLDLGFHMTARIRFRLAGIDTPERGEPGYQEATEHLESLLLKYPSRTWSALYRNRR